MVSKLYSIVVMVWVYLGRLDARGVGLRHLVASFALVGHVEDFSDVV